MIAETPRYYAALGIVRYWRWLLVLTAVLTAFLYGRCDRPHPVTHVVADTVMVERPEPKPTIKERIVYQQVPVERRVVQTEIDTVLVREFVEAATDSLRPPVVLGKAIEYDGEKLLLWGVRSDGARTFDEYDVRPTFKAGWDGDSTWAREERLARFPTKRILAGTGIVVAAVAILVAAR